MLIRAILLAAVVATLIMFVRGQHGQRVRANKRIAFFVFLAVNAYAVLRPEDVTALAVRVGVGRGADLVLYVLVVCFVFTALNLYLQQRQLERRLTDMARALALHQAEASNMGLRAADEIQAAMSVETPSESSSTAQGPAPVPRGLDRSMTPSPNAPVIRE